jgi:ribosomal protein S6E (S10)
MPLKLNISEKGKAWKLELDSESLIGKSLGEKVQGAEISPDLAGYELEITGASDIAGFAHKKDVEGQALKRVLLTKGWGMHKKPRREGKKKVSTPKGLRLRKTVRGKVLSEKTVQVNINVIKTGNKQLKEIFPEQNKEPEKPQETPVKQETQAPVEQQNVQETSQETQETQTTSEEGKNE